MKNTETEMRNSELCKPMQQRHPWLEIQIRVPIKYLGGSMRIEVF